MGECWLQFHCTVKSDTNSPSASFSSAKIIVTDKSGIVLKQVNLAGKKGSITIGAATLSSGTYQYTLYVDGKLIDTKQMVLLGGNY
jgi:hypothetical protein